MREAPRPEREGGGATIRQIPHGMQFAPPQVSSSAAITLWEVGLWVLLAGVRGFPEREKRPAEGVWASLLSTLGCGGINARSRLTDLPTIISGTPLPEPVTPPL